MIVCILGNAGICTLPGRTRPCPRPAFDAARAVAHAAGSGIHRMFGLRNFFRSSFNQIAHRNVCGKTADFKFEE
jgi:hypothetical protein